jgi:hypothetical protein
VGGQQEGISMKTIGLTDEQADVVEQVIDYEIELAEQDENDSGAPRSAVRNA